MKATVEVTNGRGDPTAVRKRTDIVNHITSLKNLIGKLLLNYYHFNTNSLNDLPLACIAFICQIVFINPSTNTHSEKIS